MKNLNLKMKVKFVCIVPLSFKSKKIILYHNSASHDRNSLGNRDSIYFLCCIINYTPSPIPPLYGTAMGRGGKG